MVDRELLKQNIVENINDNGRQKITGSKLQKQLLEMVDSMLDPEGRYPDMSVGFSDNLVGRGESTPAEFTFRASGGKSIKDGAARIKRIKGNSVVWNQKVKGFASWNLQGGTIEGNEVVWSASNRTGALNAFSNTFAQHTAHKYLISADIKASSTNVGLGLYFTNSPLVRHTGSGNYESLAIITNGTGDGIDTCYLTDVSTSEYGEIRAKNYRCIDLTQMFGAGNEPSTIEEYNARKPIVADEYAYNEGEVIHMTAEGVKSIGDNAWNQYTAVRGVVNDQTGVFTPDSNALTMVDLVRCLPGEYYFNHIVHYNYKAGLHFYDENMNFIGVDGIWDSSTNNYSSGKTTIPAEAHYMRVGTPYDAVEQCMVTLVHSGWKQDTDAGYQPYWEDTLPLPIIRKYFPQGMKSAGSAYDVIDCKKKQAITNVGVASNLSFSQMQEGVFYVDLPNMKLPTSTMERMKGIFTNRYAVETDSPSIGNMADKSIIRFADGNIYIKDMSYTNADEFNTANADLIVYYELAEPIVTEIDEPFGTDYRVADFGTEQAISSVPSAPFSADIIYQFNAVDMIREHQIEIENLKSMVATMQTYLTSLVFQEK